MKYGLAFGTPATSELYFKRNRWAIALSTDVSVVTRPLRRFFRIASGRLLHAIGSPGRSLAILDSVDPAFISLFRNKIQTEFLANNAGKKAAHRMLLPIRGRHDRGDLSTGSCPQHPKNAGVLCVGPRRAPW